MKFHFMVPTALRRLSGRNDVKSQYVFVRLSRNCNESNRSLRTVPYQILSAMKAKLNEGASKFRARSASSVKNFDSLRGNA